MSGNFEDGAQPPSEIGPPPRPTGRAPMFPTRPALRSLSAFGVSAPEPDLLLAGATAMLRPSRSWRKAVIAVAVAVSVVVAFALVASGESRGVGVHKAFASIFSSATVRVVVTAASTNPQEQAQLSKYSVILTVTSENGGKPLSGSDAVDNYAVSVMRGGVDLGDMIIADHAAYVRVNYRSIDPRSYAAEVKSLLRDVPAGSARTLVLEFLNDRWVGIDTSTIESLVRSMGTTAPEPESTVNLDNLRNSFALSFAQSWDAWASIHQLTSSNGVTKYSVKLPVQHFVSTLLKDVKGAILKAVPQSEAPIVRSVLNSAGVAIDSIPAGLALPMTLWVEHGSLTGLDVTYKGYSVHFGISHPAAGVTAPPGAAMVTTSILHSLLDDYGLCGPTVEDGGNASSTAGLGTGSSCPSSGISSASGGSGASSVLGTPGAGTSTAPSGASAGAGSGSTAGTSAGSTSSASTSSSTSSAGTSSTSASTAGSNPAA
jgi:hypothetical protein